MNEILQKRIEKAAFDHGVNCLKVMCADPEHNWPTNTEDTFKTACKWMLDNQWISVEEALPEDCENVFVRNEFGKCTSAWLGISGWHLCYGEIAGDDSIDSKITHWCPIQQLKGGEE